MEFYSDDCVNVIQASAFCPFGRMAVHQSTWRAGPRLGYHRVRRRNKQGQKVTSLRQSPERAVPAIWKPGAARRSRFGVGRDVTRPRPMYQIRRMIGADPGAATLGSCRLHHERETRWRRAGVTTEPGEGWSDGMARICVPGKDSSGRRAIADIRALVLDCSPLGT